MTKESLEIDNNQEAVILEQEVTDCIESKFFSQLAGAVEFTDWTSAAG